MLTLEWPLMPKGSEIKPQKCLRSWEVTKGRFVNFRVASNAPRGGMVSLEWPLMPQGSEITPQKCLRSWEVIWERFVNFRVASNAPRK